MSAMHEHPFDQKHTFNVNRFNDIEQYAELDETYSDPKLETYKPRVESPSSIPTRAAFSHQF
jgi:translation initiation factor 3 subunit B